MWHSAHLNSPCADSECRSERKKYIREGGPSPPVFPCPWGPSRQLPQHPQRRNAPCLTWARAVAWRCCGCCGTLQGAPPPGGLRGRGGGRPGGGHEWGPGCAQAQRPGPGHGPPPHLHPVPASGPLSRPCRGATSEMITSGNNSSGSPSISRTRWAASKMQ